MADHKSFLGQGWSFPPRFDPRTGRAQMVCDDEDITQSLRILLTTSLGERMLHPRFGLGQEVFSQADQTSITEIKKRLEDAILFYEPRIQLLKIDADTSQMAEGCVTLTLSYEVPQINSRGNMVFPFYFTEGTHARIQ